MRKIAASLLASCVLSFASQSLADESDERARIEEDLRKAKTQRAIAAVGLSLGAVVTAFGLVEVFDRSRHCEQGAWMCIDLHREMGGLLAGVGALATIAGTVGVITTTRRIEDGEAKLKEIAVAPAVGPTSGGLAVVVRF